MKIKEKINNGINTIDTAIPDITMEYAVDQTKRIGKDAFTAAVCWTGMWMCISDGVYGTAELSVRAVKTGVKKVAIGINDLYRDIPEAAIRR